MMTLEFRTELAVYLLTSLLPIMVWLLAWRSILGEQTLRGFDFNTMAAYFAVGLVIRLCTIAEFENFRVMQIRTGKIDFFLTKPISFFYEVWWRHLGATLGNILWLAGPMVLLGLWSHPWWPSVIQSSVTAYWPLILACIGFTFVMEFGMSFLTTILGFWFEEAEGLQHFKWFSISVLSGSVMPVQFMPAWLQPAIKALPFRYMYQVPIELALGKTMLRAQDVTTMILAVAVMTGLGLLLWKLAIRHYASSGG